MKIDLPDGNWWELRDTVTWGMRKAFRLAALRAGAATLGEDGKLNVGAWKKALLEGAPLDFSALEDAYLLEGTAAWSWAEPVTKAAIDGRLASEVEPVLAQAQQLYAVEPESPLGKPSPP